MLPFALAVCGERAFEFFAADMTQMYCTGHRLALSAPGPAVDPWCGSAHFVRRPAGDGTRVALSMTSAAAEDERARAASLSPRALGAPTSAARPPQTRPLAVQVLHVTTASPADVQGPWQLLKVQGAGYPRVRCSGGDGEPCLYSHAVVAGSTHQVVCCLTEGADEAPATDPDPQYILRVYSLGAVSVEPVAPDLHWAQAALLEAPKTGGTAAMALQVNRPSLRGAAARRGAPAGGVAHPHRHPPSGVQCVLV